MDTAHVQDTFRPDAGPSGYHRSSGRGGPGHNSSRGRSRSQKGYKRLWDHVKTVGRGDTLDTDGGMPSEMSVEELVKLCSSLPGGASAVAAVAPALSYLDSRAMAAFMKELAKTQHLSRAMEIFDWLKSLPADHELYGLCDVYTFTTAISMMGPSQQLRRALELVGEMRARGLSCNVHTYSALMNVCIKCDACDLALDVFKQMHEDRIRPNVVTYNTLVDVYGKTGQWEKAVRVLDDMRDEDIEPEVRTFNTAIIACNMCGQPQEALKVYQKLLESGLQPISTTYTALISAYGKAGQLDKALDTFQTMLQRGCERSVITYSALISACEKAGRWELALQLFEQMQREGCAPNTVTYNSLITACQQGGQPEKACEVFEQMKYHGCRPDVVTYTALINAYNRAGQWHKSLQAFEQMQTQNCKPDSFVYQTVIDSLWQTGVAWAQARAWQLYTAAARNWQYRFTVQAASNSSSGGGLGGGSSGLGLSRDLEYVVPAFTPGVAVLALRKWLSELVAQLSSDGGSSSSSSMMFMGRDRILLSLGRSRHIKEPGSSSACQAVMAVLAGFRSPFRPGSGAVTPGGYVVVAEAPCHAALDWLRSCELQGYLALLMPPSLPASRQPSPLGSSSSGGGGAGGPKRLSFAADLAEDAQLELSCARAYQTVAEFELGQLLQPANMSCEYLAERDACIAAAFGYAEQFELAEEVVFDAVLLMDRVMSTGAQHDSSLGRLFVAAALRIAALQTVSAADEGALQGLPGDAALAAAAGFPPGSVSKMEANIDAALGGDTKSISMLRSLKLFFERMGADQQESLVAQHLHGATTRLLRCALLEPVLLSSQPSVVAAAVLLCARSAVGCHPFLPCCIEQLTGMDAAHPQLAAAVAAVEPLTASAGLEPPPRSAPVTPVTLAPGPRPPSAGSHHLFAGMGHMPHAGSGYSTPTNLAGTPTAAAGAAPQMPQMAGGLMAGHHKSLLDPVMRQHASLQRAGSDMSSLSNISPSDGSAADLQALLASSAAAAAAASSMAGSPSPHVRMGSPVVAASEPALAAAMAGLQLGMGVGLQGMAGPSCFPQMPFVSPWMPGAAGAYGAQQMPDSYQMLMQQQAQQQQQSSRLQQVTGPYVMPMQQAMLMNNAAHLLR
uniref:PROP1-like PPR domain-containing protein n=1 Tax=Tetradesmus obliquus TaxID=3088 RepID=A0A383VDG4_TETOB|eukprot:jgi/Sobl393_1/11385/SZX63597.1